MARRTKKQQQKEKKIAMALAGIVLLAVFSALMLTVPSFDGWVRQALGIEPAVVVPQTTSISAVKVHIIDVGQGDAALLEADGEFALVDAGTPEAQDTLVEYLRAAGVKELRYVFMTHPHADHIGGMQKVVESFPVGTMVLPRLELAPYPTTSLFVNLLETLLQKQVPTEEAAEGGAYALGGGTVTVLHDGLRTTDNYNLLSLGLLFEADGLRFLDTGDAETANESAMLQSGQSLAATVFMAGHHGSSTSNSADFVAAVAPQLVVVSCGKDNSYGHPHASPLAAYEAVGAQVLRTDWYSHVVVQPDGAGGVVYAAAQQQEAA